MRIPSFLLPTALGSVVVSGASFNVADKAAYTLFDAPLSAEAPPKDLFPADDTLKSWLPPRFVATSGSPIPTNNWWGNIIAASGDSTVQPVWSVPYALRPLVFEAPFGLAANYPYTTRQLIGSSNNGNANQFLTHWFVNDFIFSAAEWTAAPTFQVASWDDMGVSVLFYSSATAKMTATLVSGMAYVTTKYEQLTPKFASAAAVTSVNGASISAGAKVSGMRFVITLNNGEKWVLYTEKSITLSLVDLTTLQATGVYSGYARVAIVTSDAQLAALDKSYKCLLDGSNVEAQDATNYIFHLKTSGDCSNGLFHYLQVHHMDTLDTTSASAVAGATVMSSTRGPMAGVVTRTSPPVLRFAETQSVPVDFYPPRRPLSSVVADQKIKETLIADINATWNVPTDGSYYFNGKAVNKYANLCLMANDDVVSGSDKAILLGQCLEKLRAVLAPFGSNTWSSPLHYDTVYRGILSSLGLNTKNADLDFGNSVYNDHHYHYGYWIATAAIVNYLDSAWSGLAQLNRVATFLIRDVANPSKSDTAFPKFRQLDWFRGHSFSHGITPMNDGKDEESLSEDINFHYAVALFGKATGRTGLANVGQLMLKLNTRAAQNYFLMTDDNRVFPPSIIPNKVPGILFDNKVAYTTWFSSDKFAIHGIQMIPASPVTEFYRSTQFVKEEWNDVLSKISAVVDDDQWNPWLSLLYINYATIDPTLAMQKLQTVNMDDGLTRSWALYMAATRPAAMNINPTPTTSVPNTTAPPVTTAPAATTTAPVTTAPTPTTTAPAPTTTAPATTAPAPVATSPSPTTAAPATTAPAPTTATPTPTTPSPSPTTLAPATTSPPPTTTAPAPASGAWCGSDVVGVQACAAGEYCQPWDPYFYQCRVVNTATCGVQQTNVDFYGDDLTTIQVLLPELCCDKCRATTGCVAYTFVNYNADGKAYCYLKKGFGTKRTTVGAVSAVIVPVTPAPTTPAPTTAAPTMPPPTTPAPTTVKPASGAWCGSDAAGVQACPTGEYCQPWDPSFYQCRYIDKATCGVQQTGVDFYGDDLTTVPTLLPEECCAKCRATSGCKAYTFVNYNADGKAYCYLKKGAGTPRPAVGAVSAVLPTSTTPAPTTRAPSTTAPATPTPSVCGVASGGQCGSASTGVTCCPSGEYCQPWDPYYYQCRPVPAQCGTQEVGVDYYGNDLQTIQGILPADCCAKCAATYGCKAYTFVNYNANWQSACYLKSGIGAKKSVVGAVSAIVLSPRASPCSFTRNIDFYGNDLQTITGVTEDQCCLSCQSTANCKAFTLVGSSCYLKTSSTGSKFLTGATSGVIG